MKKALLIILFTQALIASSEYYCWVKKLSIREQPDPDSQVIGFVNEGDAVKIIQSEQGIIYKTNLNGLKYYSKWSKIQYMGKTGYVYEAALESNKGSTKNILKNYNSLYSKYLSELNVRSFKKQKTLLKEYFTTPKKILSFIIRNADRKKHKNYSAYQKAIIDVIDEKYRKMLGKNFYDDYSKSLLTEGDVASGYFPFLFDNYKYDKILNIKKIDELHYKVSIKRTNFFNNDYQESGISPSEVSSLVKEYKIKNISQEELNKKNLSSFKLQIYAIENVILSKNRDYFLIESINTEIEYSILTF